MDKINWSSFEDEFKSIRNNIDKVWEGDFEKAEKDLSKLTKKVVTVTRNGRTFRQTVWVKQGEESKEQETPVGEELTPIVSGMNVTKYSDKALLITGDTYVNKDKLREIKNEVGVGSWNRSLNGWVFPIKFLETILGFLWSDQIKGGNEEKAEAIQNQKNAGLEKGDSANIQGVDGKVEENVSDSEGTKYNVKLNDGTKLEGVDEKVMDKQPETNDKKISDIINNANPSNRVSTEKKLYGIKPIENIHQYSLPEYMKMHGLSQEDIDKVIQSLTKKKESSDTKRTSTGGGGNKPKSDKTQIEGLTKRQLIGKLVYQHYQAVKKAIENGEELKSEILETYPDLKEAYGKKRQAMSEETKRKISEALKKNKVPENDNPEIKKKNEEAEEQGLNQPDKENYKPKEEGISLTSPNGTKKHKVYNYLDIPPLDVYIPKQKGILEKPRPYFIPEIKDEEMKQMGFQIQAVKVSDDKYLVALENYFQGDVRRTFKNGETIEKKVDIPFAYLTLDQVAATEQYYRLREKERVKQAEDKRFEKRIEAVRQIHPELSEKEILNKAKKSFTRSRASILTDRKTTYSNNNLYSNSFGSRIIPPTSGSFWTHQRKLRKDIQQKFEDLSMQQEYIDSAYTKGAETSFGNKNTKDDLMSDYGVKVKRQNGDEINKSEINQIKEALDVTSKLFGNNKEMNKEFGLKISHAGEVNMHARKAIGLFTPRFNAIGVSSKYGGNKFQFTFGHEYAHFMDYWIGKKTGNTYASDKEGSIAQKIADTFRENMNDKETKSAYLRRTCECFARALEQYTAIETYGKDIVKFEDYGVKYTDMPEQVNYETYEKQIKPLIKQFLEENKEILKSNTLFSDLFS